MGSSASTQRKPNQIKPEACSCESPGWRTRPGTDPLIYQLLLAPTSAPPQLKPTSRIFIIYHSLLCVLNTVSPGVHTLSAPPPFTQTPSCAFTPALPAHRSSCHQVSASRLQHQSTVPAHVGRGCPCSSASGLFHTDGLIHVS